MNPESLVRSHRRRPCRGARRAAASGFTLLELLVVLVILVLVAQTAVLSVDAMVDAERRDSTVVSLDAARAAIVGRDHVVDPSGRVWIEGFVNDVGRLPKPSEAGALPELFSKPAGMPSFKEQPVAGTAIPGAKPARMFCGWRGPYLKLGVGADDWVDGWARAFDARLEVDPAVLTIRSAGADGEFDGATPGEGANRDLELRIDENDIHGEFVVDWTRPEDPADPAEIRLEIWHPKNGSPVAAVTDWRSAATAPARVYTGADEIPIGHRTLVALVRPDSESPPSRIVRLPITISAQGLVGGDLLLDLGWPDGPAPQDDPEGP